MTTLDQLIVEVITQRASEIKISNGYLTDLGDNILDESIILAPDFDEFPAMFINDSDEEHLSQISDDLTERGLSIYVVAYIQFSHTDDAAQLARNAARDVKVAILDSSDKKLGGLLSNDLLCASRIVSRPPSGGSIVSISLEFTAQFFEKYGNPTEQI